MGNQKRMRAALLGVGICVLVAWAAALPVNSAPSTNQEGEDTFVASSVEQSKMLNHAFEVDSPDKAAEEAKMNDTPGDAPLTADQERAEAIAILSAGESRMNSEGADDVPQQPVVVVQVLASKKVTEDDGTYENPGDMNSGTVTVGTEDDRDLNSSMNNPDVNTFQNNKMMMPSVSTPTSGNEPSAFDTMNSIQNGKKFDLVQPEQVKVASKPPSAILKTPSVSEVSVAPSSVIQHDTHHEDEGEAEVRMNVSAHEMDAMKGDDEMQQPAEKAVMPAVSQGVMQEPAPQQQDQSQQNQQQAAVPTTVMMMKAEPAIEEITRMNTAVTPSIAMPSSSSGVMWEPNTDTREMDAVIEQTTVKNTRTSNEEATKKETKSVMNEPVVTQTNDDGAMMGDLSKAHTSQFSQPAKSAIGYMDAADSDSKFASEMNTVVPGLNMMASFLMLSSDPYYNQYAPLTSPPKAVVAGIPAATHPYGLPYFRRDPFLPLQTPYYHIPAFDNPRSNPALTPYYNPFVNPPPPVPPSVPAAPSFFPFHSHQHMIAPYFPYPPPPVLQPGAFPPFALPSHIAPGNSAPDHKTSRLPPTSSQDPF